MSPAIPYAGKHYKYSIDQASGGHCIRISGFVSFGVDLQAAEHKRLTRSWTIVQRSVADGPGSARGGPKYSPAGPGSARGVQDIAPRGLALRGGSVEKVKKATSPRKVTFLFLLHAATCPTRRKTPKKQLYLVKCQQINKKNTQ